MPDTDAPSRSESSSAPAGAAQSAASQPAPLERVNLPVPVARPGEPPREGGDGWITRVLRVMFGWNPTTIRADLQTVLENGAVAESGFSPEERTMLKNILALRGRRIDDVMVPRADIIAVQQDISLGELIKVFEGAGHSRLVVYKETLDDPVGMAHIRDVIGYMVRHAASATAKARRKKPLPAGLDLKAIDLSVSLSAAAIIREVLFVPPSMPAIDLLAKMQATRIHLALVIDEYGGTDGIVSIEDIVEQIVGDIEDEHDEDELPAVVRQPDGSFLADARAPLEDVVATVGPEFEVSEATEEVDTLAGYIMTRVGRLPSRGEVVSGPGDFEIEVLDADPRRLKRVRITRHKGRPGRRERNARRAETRNDAPVADNQDRTPPPKGSP
jgi:CBS domain containing-hemolysin-like protein